VSTVVVSARPAVAPNGVRHLAAPIMAWLSAAVDAAFRFYVQRRDARRLRDMADSQLSDLGIVRSDIARVVREGR
jgi:uncharacterized protein YjiS (DUF1127 family)